MEEVAVKRNRRLFSSKSRRRKKLRLAKRDGLLCTICFVPAASVDELTIDHIIPFSRGGEDMPWNWALAHCECNAAKADNIIEAQRSFVKAKKSSKTTVYPRAD